MTSLYLSKMFRLLVLITFGLILSVSAFPTDTSSLRSDKRENLVNTGIEYSESDLVKRDFGETVYRRDYCYAVETRRVTVNKYARAFFLSQRVVLDLLTKAGTSIAGGFTAKEM